MQPIISTLLGRIPDIDTSLLLDAIWLSTHLPPPPERSSTPKAASSLWERIPIVSDFLKYIGISSPRAPEERQRLNEYKLQMPSRRLDSTDRGRDAVDVEVTLPFPDSEALPDKHRCVQVLRRLHRRIVTPNQSELDIDATIDLYAETGLFVAEWQRTTTLRYRVVLIIDENPTAFLWHRAGQELHASLCSSRAFRSTRLLRLNSNGTLRENNTIVSPSHIRDPDGRTIVMIATDAIADCWHDGRVSQLLATWASSQPTVIVQWLPERLWTATALSRGAATLLRRSPETKSCRQTTTRSLRRGNAKYTAAIPIITVNTDSIQSWTALFLRPGLSRHRGVFLPLHDHAQPHNLHEIRSPEETLTSFNLYASNDARRLLRLLSVVPVRLPVIRLVRRTLLPQSDPSIEAEVLLSGLIRKVSAHDPEQAEFDFVDNVRSQVRSTLPSSEIYNVLKTTAKAFGITFGGQSFESIIASGKLVETESKNFTINEDASAFAIIAIDSIRMLGGRYRAIADQLDAYHENRTTSQLDGNSSVTTSTDLKRLVSIPDKIEVEFEERPGHSYSMKGTEFCDLVRSGILVRDHKCRVRGSELPFTPLGDTIIYAILRREFMQHKPHTEKNDGRGQVCRASCFKGLEREAVRCERLLPPKTSTVSEAVVLITRSEYGIYVHSNYVTNGYENATKLLTNSDIGLLEVLQNIVFASSAGRPTDGELRKMQMAHLKHVRYIVDLAAFDPDGPNWLSIQGAENVQLVIQLEEATGVDSTGECALSLEISMLLSERRFDEVVALSLNSSRLASDPDSLNSLAWFFATTAESKYRDGQRAAELSKKCIAVGGVDANRLDTLAAAHAATGNYAMAVHVQQDAINRAGKSASENFLLRLTRYRNQRPWIE